MRSLFRNTTVFAATFLALNLALPGSALAARLPTTVTIDLSLADGDADPSVYRIKTKVTKPTKRKCRRGRKVIVYNDENFDGDFDDGEQTFGKGRTNRKGKFAFKTSDVFGRGYMRVIVKRNEECKKGAMSTRFRGR